MERFEAIVVLATNLFRNLDTAALRRFTLEFSLDGNDPAGLSHCAQLDSRRYAQDVRRHMLTFCAVAREARC